MILVTGGAGFIGSNLVRALNRRGHDDVLVVDNLGNAEKIGNLDGLRISDYMDKNDLFDQIRTGSFPASISAVFHQGACSDTMETDGQYVLRNNFTFSKYLFECCSGKGIPLIYASSASVYGNGTRFEEIPENESALNAYAWSKLVFDNYVRSRGDLGFQCVGLRYFNVYGPGESHKGRMASVAWHFQNQYRESNTVRLFEGTVGYDAGEQLRDFVYVDDVVDVNLHFLDHPETSGIFNVGTGNCQSFNDVALAVINSSRKKEGREPISLETAVSGGEITYIPFPEALRGKYQSYTEAHLDNLRAAGYEKEFFDVATGVSTYAGIQSQNQ